MYFLNKKSLSRTEIMKYLYLYEYIYRKHIGKQSTELEFVRWDHGPFEQSVYTSLEFMEYQGLINSSTYFNFYGHKAYKYSARTSNDSLSNTEKEVADYVLYEFSRKTFQGMLELVYSTAPMLNILEREEQEGRQLIGEVLSMNETKGVYKRTRAGREAAFERLKSKERVRGTEEDYTSVILNEYKAHEILRRRAAGVSPRFDS